jgi:hypothetical protein
MKLADVSKILRETMGLKTASDGRLILLASTGQMVDLFEAYTQVVLEDIGLTVHWVDTWYYHVLAGEIHCGTNVKRRPPGVQPPAGFKHWWDVYPDLAAANFRIPQV